MYVIRHSDTGKYVARPGSQRSYTDRLEDARMFPTRGAAQRDRCEGNETIVAVSDVLRGV